MCSLLLNYFEILILFLILCKCYYYKGVNVKITILFTFLNLNTQREVKKAIDTVLPTTKLQLNSPSLPSLLAASCPLLFLPLFFF